VRHASTGASPYYMVTGEKPCLKNIKVFGCRADVLILPTPSKFERRAEAGVLLDCLSYGVYKVLVPSKDGRESKIIISRHFTFDEEEPPGLKDMEDIMDRDGASDSSYTLLASKSKAQTPVMTVTTPTASQSILMLLRSILHIRIILVIAALNN
jgi:hypothetical protein